MQRIDYAMNCRKELSRKEFSENRWCKLYACLIFNQIYSTNNLIISVLIFIQKLQAYF